MEFNKDYISELLNLYKEGETSLKQEQELKLYFSSEDYDKEFEAYAKLFKFFEIEYKTQMEDQVKGTDKKSSSFWINIAASICIVLGGLWFYDYYQNQLEMEEARQAFKTTQNALNLLSNNMNEGLEKLEYVDVFSTQKNKLIK
ncbi:hypothetical protein [Psychroflexus lacisalsi]|jgi:hypothetical protein|uniref:Uncharacterized protein n=1 Tax=Psychroflexus lacisalsi TaxID=503928 RepID=A0ABN1K8A3_9FLAO|nr:hypothetical protein [Psychroflexus lacisalsi]MBZ9619602.1 hypothetical protein [Psychroflexus lacisalsi]